MTAITYHQYTGEHDLPHIMSLVEHELSKPYVVYTSSTNGASLRSLRFKFNGSPRLPQATSLLPRGRVLDIRCHCHLSPPRKCSLSAHSTGLPSISKTAKYFFSRFSQVFSLILGFSVTFYLFFDFYKLCPQLL
jgi:hypothetical protein